MQQISRRPTVNGPPTGQSLTGRCQPTGNAGLHRDGKHQARQQGTQITVGRQNQQTAGTTPRQDHARAKQQTTAAIKALELERTFICPHASGPEAAWAEVEWQETGGPPVATQRRRGFGTELIEKVVAHELRQPVTLDFAPTGVRCVLRVPVRRPADFRIREKDGERGGARR